MVNKKKSFEIIIGNQYDYYNISKNVSSIFYIKINGDFAFPDEEWTDLPISILDMWCSNLMENKGISVADFSLFFMDGPFFIRCSKLNERVILRFINNRKDDERIVIEGSISYKELVDEVSYAGNNLISLIEKDIEKNNMLEILKTKLEILNR